ncbi:MAG: hypothetical protein HY822_24640 [Acidobacteria bacterium]|nr:hypothetical protein [Acidobacteriota bacterium]
MRLLTIALMCASLGAAQTAQEKGKRLADEMLAALGGEKFLSMRDRAETGRAYSFYNDQLRGLSVAKIYTRYVTRPEPPAAGFFGLRERQAFGKNEDSAVLFTEDGKGWQITFRGARPVPEETLARYRESTLRNVFYILRQRLGEPGLLFDFRRSDVWSNMAVDVVDITDSNNLVTTVFVQQTTKLPVRQEFIRRDPKTRDRFEEVTVFSKYRETGGVQWPHVIQRERNGEKLFEMYAESVTVNQGLTDELFTLPVSMKLLRPAR